MGLFETNLASLGEWMRAGGCSQEERQEAAVMLGSLQQLKNIQKVMLIVIKPQVNKLLCMLPVSSAFSEPFL